MTTGSIAGGLSQDSSEIIRSQDKSESITPSTARKANPRDNSPGSLRAPESRGLGEHLWPNRSVSATLARGPRGSGRGDSSGGGQDADPEAERLGQRDHLPEDVAVGDGDV